MHSLRTAGRWSVMAVGAALMVGCADLSTAPETASPAPTTAASFRSLIPIGEKVATTFTVTPDGGAFRLAGGHKVYFGPNAICNPLTSGYGAEYWNAPCEPVTTPMTLTAISWTDSAGRPRVEFLTDLRFQPTPAGSQYPARVLLALRDKAGALDANAALFYCPTLGECYDESITDPSLASIRDPKSGWVYRFVKHFSGYNVSTGRSTTLEGDVSTVEEGLTTTETME